MRATLRATAASEDRQLAGEADIAWTFADHPASDAQPRDRVVDRLVAEIYAARAHRDAVECNRLGDYDGAAGILAATERRVRSYAGNDEALNRIVESLERDQGVFAALMSPASLKRWHSDSVGQLSMRDLDGRARRRDPEAGHDEWREA